MAIEHERSYSDQEFALILNRAAELSASAESSPRRRSGLSLEEIKAIAIEAGFDPGSIDRAARQLPVDSGASAVERAIGGRLKHELTAHFDVPITEERAAHLLAIVRAAADQHGIGDSGTGGMSWNSAGEGSQLFVTAHREEEGTRVRVAVNGREALAIAGVLSLSAGLIIPFIAAANFGFESLAVNSAIFAGGLGGSVAAARAFWSSATKRYQRRANELMDVVARTLDQSSISRKAGERSESGSTPGEVETGPPGPTP
jgi:hypothetical protein